MALPAVAVKAAKVAVSMLTTKEGRKTLGKTVIVLLSPIIFLAILIFVFLEGGSKHNNDMIHLCFYGGEIPAYTPADFNDYITDMRDSFGLLDAQIADANALPPRPQNLRVLLLHHGGTHPRGGGAEPGL